MNKITKRDVKFIIVGIVLGLIFAGTGVYAAILYQSSDVSYDNSNSGLSSTNVQAALDELKARSSMCPARFNVGDYFTMVPDTSSYTISGSNTGHAIEGAPYTENSGTGYYTFRSTQYYCCAATKPSIDSTGYYPASSFGRVIGTSIKNRYCYTSGSDYNTATCSLGIRLLYVPPSNASTNTGTTMNCTRYEITGTYNLTDQTISPNELTLWRVIAINNDGSVEAISEYTTPNYIYFEATTGYKKYVETLQTIASKFSKSGYTSSTRMVGYSGQTSILQSTSAFDGSLTTPPSTTSTSSPTTGTGEEFSNGLLGDTLYLEDYTAISNVYKSDTTTYGTTGLKAHRLGSQYYGDYWLASRKYTYNSGTYYTFGGRYISSSGSLSNNVFRYYNSGWRTEKDDHNINENRSYIRPIITLNSEVTIKNGAGTIDEPYTLN